MCRGHFGFLLDDGNIDQTFGLVEIDTDDDKASGGAFISPISSLRSQAGIDIYPDR
jgi:hypothetical protein